MVLLTVSVLSIEQYLVLRCSELYGVWLGRLKQLLRRRSTRDSSVFHTQPNRSSAQSTEGVGLECELGVNRVWWNSRDGTVTINSVRPYVAVHTGNTQVQ
jgi:hypothetical protein